MKASNDTDMNVGTSADGGYAVPTGHYNGIIARLDEAALYGKLGGYADSRQRYDCQRTA
jgi:hypothetical protein